MLHPQAVAALADAETEWAPPLSDPGTDLAAVRRAADVAAPGEHRRQLPYVRDVDADGVPARLYRPRVGSSLLLYVHGGGWMLGGLDTHDRFVRYLAARTGWSVLSVGYRLAPEHPYPAPLDDVQRACGWARRRIADHGVSDAVVVGAGDSSGANLVVGLSVRDPAAFALQVLAYPPLDPSGDYASFETEANALLPVGDMRWFWRAYAPDAADRVRPEVAPAYVADLSRMPATYLLTAEHDILRDEGEAFAARLAEAGVEVVAHRALGMPHGYWRRPWDFDAAAASVDHLAGTLARLVP